MWLRWARWLAWAICTLMVVSALGSAVVALSSAGAVVSLAKAVELITWVSQALAFGGVGALIISRMPRQPIGWLLLCPAVLNGLAVPLTLYMQALVEAPAPPAPSLALLLLLWFSNWGWMLLIQPIGLVALLFPTGRPPGPRWGWLLSATAVLAAAFIIVVTLQREIAWVDDPRLVLGNPIGVIEGAVVEQVVAVWIGCQLLILALSGAALLARFRRADPIERVQIRWLLSASGLFLMVYILSGVTGIGGSAGLAGDLSMIAINVCLVLIPIAIGVAILRHRLYDIDVIIRRTLIYTVLTLMLAAIYVGSVVVLQGLFVRLTGQASTLAVVASTLGIAALFRPLRVRVQGIIDRRFFRRKYDAQQVLAQFAKRAQQQSDLDVVSADLLATVQETLEPDAVRLWLVQRS